MKLDIRNFLIAVLMLQGTAVAANEYIPPPPGPYQSAVVIDMVEGDASQKHQVYKFPQAEELFQSNEPDYARPNTPSPLLSVPESSIQNSSKGYSDPQIDTIMPPLNQSYPDTNVDSATPPWYGSQANNNPWPANTLTPRQPYPGGWNYQNYDYGYYYPYPNQYRRQKNMFNMPFSGMPSPWTMQPSQPYTGR